jgi:hypothetical protein
VFVSELAVKTRFCEAGGGENTLLLGEWQGKHVFVSEMAVKTRFCEGVVVKTRFC